LNIIKSVFNRPWFSGKTFENEIQNLVSEELENEEAEHLRKTEIACSNAFIQGYPGVEDRRCKT